MPLIVSHRPTTRLGATSFQRWPGAVIPSRKPSVPGRIAAGEPSPDSASFRVPSSCTRREVIPTDPPGGQSRRRPLRCPLGDTRVSSGVRGPLSARWRASAWMRGAQRPIASSSAVASGGGSSAAPATFSCRCATDAVPGMSSMFGERCNSQASATAIGVASSRSATTWRASDCRAEKPPSGNYGKYGTYAMPCRAVRSTRASSSRRAML